MEKGGCVSSCDVYSGVRALNRCCYIVYICDLECRSIAVHRSW